MSTFFVSFLSKYARNCNVISCLKVFNVEKNFTEIKTGNVFMHYYQCVNVNVMLSMLFRNGLFRYSTFFILEKLSFSEFKNI